MWIFSHCDTSAINDKVDELATYAAENPDAPPEYAWYVDAARARYGPQRLQYFREARPLRSVERPVTFMPVKLSRAPLRTLSASARAYAPASGPPWDSPTSRPHVPSAMSPTRTGASLACCT